MPPQLMWYGALSVHGGRAAGNRDCRGVGPGCAVELGYLSFTEQSTEATSKVNLRTEVSEERGKWKSSFLRKKLCGVSEGISGRVMLFTTVW
jgi:hypothetical protein